MSVDVYDLSALRELKGHTRPRIFTPPLRPLTPETTLGFDAIHFAHAVMRVELLPWQQFWLLHALELNSDCSGFRFRTVVTEVARQNGKSLLGKVLITWRLYASRGLLPDGRDVRILGAAQSLTKAEELWEEVVAFAEVCPPLMRRIGQVRKVNGAKRFAVDHGKEWRPKSGVPPMYTVEALKPDAGRGITAGLLFLDELREHKNWDAYSALGPTTSVPDFGQIVTMSNAGDKTAVVLRTLRDKAVALIEAGRSDASSVGYLGWSAPPGMDYRDPRAIPWANPAVGWTLKIDAVLADLETMSEGDYRTEHLCQWVDVLEPGIIPADVWRDTTDEKSRRAPGADVFVGVDMSYDRARVCVSIIAKRADGTWHAETVRRKSGSDWLLPWLTEREGKFAAVALQTRGAPVSSLGDGIKALGVVEVVDWSGSDLTIAHGAMFDLLLSKQLWHRPQPALDDAAATARAKSLGDAWVFDRKNSPDDPSPLISMCAALHAARSSAGRRSTYEDNDLLVM